MADDKFRRLSPGQISEEFNAVKRGFFAEHDKTGLNEALTQLGFAVAELRSAGIDVALEMRGTPTEQSFDLFSSAGGLTVPVSGTLTVAGDRRLVAIATKEGNDCLKLAVSEYDVSYAMHDAYFTSTEPGKEVKISGKIRATTFDLAAEGGLAAFQKRVIRIAARNAAVAERDQAQAFGPGRSLVKTGLKPKGA